VAATDVKAAFDLAAGAFVAEVRAVGPQRLADPGTAQWSVAELIGHGARAFLATETVLASPVDPTTRRLDGAADYFRVAMASTGVHEGISQRAREAASDLGDSPFETVRADATRVVRLVAATPMQLEVQHRAGRLSFGEYLRTRVAELVLHTVDLQLALGVAPSAPTDAATVVRDLMVELADRADALGIACVLTGRAWPAGCNVLS
jgi:hypothetical protein